MEKALHEELILSHKHNQLAEKSIEHVMRCRDEICNTVKNIEDGKI